MTNGTSQSGLAPEPDDWDALARYLAGESPPEEAETMREWLDADPTRGDSVAALDGALGRLAFKAPRDLDVEHALARVSARMDAPRRWNLAGLRAAAVVVLFLGGSLVFWQTRQSGEGPTAQTFATAVGARDSVRLPDGTSVLLGPGSQLVMAAGYGEETREVRLRGEALFNVAHDAARPFTVHAGSASIRDIGTAFSVHTDAAERVRVVVTSGAVVLHADSSPERDGVILRAGDRGVLDAGARAVAQRSAATEDDLAWTRGKLVFNNATMSQVSADLRRWYGVEVRLADSTLARQHLTASFAGEPAGQVFEVLKLALDATVTMRGDTAVLARP